jgi:hypothetical protein
MKRVPPCSPGVQPNVRMEEAERWFKHQHKSPVEGTPARELKPTATHRLGLVEKYQEIYYGIPLLGNQER